MPLGTLTGRFFGRNRRNVRLLACYQTGVGVLPDRIIPASGGDQPAPVCRRPFADGLMRPGRS